MKSISHRTKMIIRGIITIFLFYNAVIFQYIPFSLFNKKVEDFAGNMRLGVLLSTFGDLILILILLFMYKKDLKDEFIEFKKDWKRKLDTGIGCWVVGLIIMVVSNTLLITIFHAEGANNEVAVREMIGALPLIMGINVCILAPFIEEIVFRKTLKDVFKNPIIFITLSFLLFGYAHVSSMATNFVDWLYIIPYGALGGAFALAYYKTDSIYTTMCLHMMHNLFVFLIVLVF